MHKVFRLSCVFSLFLICSCAMFKAWQAIPPPGGCDQCHTLPISANWQLAYTPPILTDERNHNYFQTPEYNMPRPDQPASSMEIRKVEDQKCFECHKAPNAAHKERMGHYHHL